MGVSLINKVKYSKTIYSLYSWAGSIVVNVVKWFVKKDNHLIVFVRCCCSVLMLRYWIYCSKRWHG